MGVWGSISQANKKLIQKRIKDTRKSYTKAEQRAELLSRNADFIGELRKLKEFGRQLDESFPSELRKAWSAVFEGPIETMLGGFCDRWDIDKKWDAELLSLFKHVRIEPLLLHIPKRTDDFTVYFYFLDPRNPDCLLLKIDPWTTLEDIATIWHRIEGSKKKIFGFSDRDKWNFGDALCWYDLRENFGLSLRKIANLWVHEKAPHIQDIESYRTTIREGIKRITCYISRGPQKPIPEDASENPE